MGSFLPVEASIGPSNYGTHSLGKRYALSPTIQTMFIAWPSVLMGSFLPAEAQMERSNCGTRSPDKYYTRYEQSLKLLFIGYYSVLMGSSWSVAIAMRRSECGGRSESCGWGDRTMTRRRGQCKRPGSYNGLRHPVPLPDSYSLPSNGTSVS